MATSGAPEPKSESEEKLLSQSYDKCLSKAFKEKRHVEKIEGSTASPQCWRMKERMKTVSVALVMCLNVGVDPPGIVKTQPCARLECWIDPLSLAAQKALETIGAALQKQYERWQPRARYKQSLDPTSDEVKKLCSSLRRNAKEERVLFHYNGHGVPQPTNNGEIWVFNKDYTQYIPLSIYNLQTWMGSPSIYVYDCCNAGLIIKSFHQFADQHQKEYEELKSRGASYISNCPPPNFTSCIQLAACLDSQILPMSPDLPADLFTSCLTTPIKIALRWFVLQNKDKLLPSISLDVVEKIPGQLNDRRTMLGELNWIFTAITDTIAWNVLPRGLFQRLFRQDLLVASLFRNFLLAERIMRAYDCTPISSPRLPPTYQHPMWQAWDYALDLCLSQLPRILEDSPTPSVNSNTNSEQPFSSTIFHSPSPFFEEQLTAFQVWLSLGNEERAPPEQLPIVLQVLLSQVHRVRALELLGRFLDLGSWAVNLALSVGIFPYVLKLLQSSARELRPLLVFIWAKILAVDHSCQADLVRDGCHRYFIAMVGDASLPSEHRTLAVFVLSNIVRKFRADQPLCNIDGQYVAMADNALSTCLEVLELTDENDSELRKWICICLGLLWADFSDARWVGVRDSAHEKLFKVLKDSNPEVRAAAVFALGSFINTTGSGQTEHSNSIDHSVAVGLITNINNEECSSLVRQELVVALHNFILSFESTFVSIEQQNIVNLESQMGSPIGGQGMKRISSQAKMRLLSHVNNPLATVTGAESHVTVADSLRRVASSGSLSTSGKPVLSFGHIIPNPPVGGVHGKVWTTMVTLERDPFPGVNLLARTVMESVRKKAKENLRNEQNKSNSMNNSYSSNRSPSSSINKGSITSNKSPSPDDIKKFNSSEQSVIPIIATKYIDWCWDRFAKPTIPESQNVGFTFTGSVTHPADPQDPENLSREWRYKRNAQIRRECFKRHKDFPGRIEENVFSSKNVPNSGSSSSSPLNPSLLLNSSLLSLVKLHDYDKIIAVSEVSMFSIYDIGETPRLLMKCENSTDARITSMEWVNVHDDSVLLIGSDDGSVSCWKPNYFAGKARLRSAWNALSDLTTIANSSKTSGLLLKWDCEKLMVLATGNSKYVKVWDAVTEMKFGEWPTGSDCPVTCIDTNRCEPHLAVLGFEDGAVKVIDFRLPASDCTVVTWRDFGDSYVVGSSMRYNHSVVAGGSNGKVKFYDLRTNAATKTVETTLDITTIAIHPHMPYFACGCFNHSVNIYGFLDQSAFASNTIRDGKGTVSSLHFHPYRPVLATVDAYNVNVYKAKGSHF